MEELNINDLDVALQRCNQVVNSYKSNPEPLNDRSLLYILMGQTSLACKDVSNALSLLDQQGKAADPMIRHELTVRQGSCKQRLNITESG